MENQTIIATAKRIRTHMRSDRHEAVERHRRRRARDLAADVVEIERPPDREHDRHEHHRGRERERAAPDRPPPMLGQRDRTRERRHRRDRQPGTQLVEEPGRALGARQVDRAEQHEAPIEVRRGDAVEEMHAVGVERVAYLLGEGAQLDRDLAARS